MSANFMNCHPLKWCLAACVRVIFCWALWNWPLINLQRLSCHRRIKRCRENNTLWNWLVRKGSLPWCDHWPYCQISKRHGTNGLTAFQSSKLAVIFQWFAKHFKLLLKFDLYSHINHTYGFPLPSDILFDGKLFLIFFVPRRKRSKKHNRP